MQPKSKFHNQYLAFSKILVMTSTVEVADETRATSKQRETATFLENEETALENNHTQTPFTPFDNIASDLHKCQNYTVQ